MKVANLRIETDGTYSGTRIIDADTGVVFERTLFSIYLMSECLRAAMNYPMGESVVWLKTPLM